ncbi:bacteriohemerythrin [Hahella ganghwensis]|uniref:bacteriohemerythrin n=1 Tax=Hahella ganghwensis TaxID=286420 RepID=UPI000382CDEF|nr:bacteriohemerythrin [Hahella ganghwensis]
MAIFIWKESYRVGIKVIDEQHKVLVRIINELDDLLKTDFSAPHAQTLFGELLDYTKYHFATEERLMKVGGYRKSALDAHLKQHYQFIDEIHSLNNENIPVTADEAELVMSYLTNWLKNHILKVDRQLANYLLKQEKALPETGPLFIPIDELESLHQSLGEAVSELRRQCDTDKDSPSAKKSASALDSLNKAKSLIRKSTGLIEQAGRTLSESEED